VGGSVTATRRTGVVAAGEAFDAPDSLAHSNPRVFRWKSLRRVRVPPQGDGVE